VSTPNGSHYPDGFSGNPHHVKEFTQSELEALLGRHFGRVEMYSQTIEPPGVAGDAAYSAGAYPVRPRLLAERQPLTESEPFVWVAVCREPIR
jgi:hypothetical protein